MASDKIYLFFLHLLLFYIISSVKFSTIFFKSIIELANLFIPFATTGCYVIFFISSFLSLRYSKDSCAYFILFYKSLNEKTYSKSDLSINYSFLLPPLLPPLLLYSSAILFLKNSFNLLNPSLTYYIPYFAIFFSSYVGS